MRRIINGVAYDTKKAKLIHEWDNGYSSSDFKNCSESLYRTDAGRWFLYGSGGPLSKYAEPVSGGKTGGDSLDPMTEVDAKLWLEEHAPAHVYENYFEATEA